jgi:hypothetical protein
VGVEQAAAAVRARATNSGRVGMSTSGQVRGIWGGGVTCAAPGD